jgi:hypothetical protein
MSGTSDGVFPDQTLKTSLGQISQQAAEPDFDVPALWYRPGLRTNVLSSWRGKGRTARDFGFNKTVGCKFSKIPTGNCGFVR